MTQKHTTDHFSQLDRTEHPKHTDRQTCPLLIKKKKKTVQIMKPAGGKKNVREHVCTTPLPPWCPIYFDRQEGGERGGGTKTPKKLKNNNKKKKTKNGRRKRFRESSI
jgi:hypothetical protein